MLPILKDMGTAGLSRNAQRTLRKLRAMNRTICSSMLLGTLVLLASCASPGGGSDAPYDAQTPIQQAARASGDAETRPRLAMLLPPGDAIGDSRYDACFQYRNNWKIQDPHRIECHLHLTQAIAVSNLIEGIKAVDARSTQAGCARPGLFAETLRYYTEANGAGANGRYKRPTNLPEANFECGDGTRLRVQFLNPDAGDDAANALRNIDAMIGAMKIAQVELAPYSDADQLGTGDAASAGDRGRHRPSLPRGALVSGGIAQ